MDYGGVGVSESGSRDQLGPELEIAGSLAELDVSAALDLVFTTGNAGDGFRVGDVLFSENAFCEGVGIVGFEHGNGALKDDGAVVEVLVNEVDSAARDFYAVVEGLLLGVESGECRKQRWMDIEDAVGESGNEAGREQAHIAGETDQMDLVLAEAGYEISVMVGAGTALGDAKGGWEAKVSGGGKAGCVGNV